MVESQNVDNNGRLTALALHPRASNLGAIGGVYKDFVVGNESFQLTVVCLMMHHSQQRKVGYIGATETAT